MEQMTPIFRRGAFESVWHQLATMPDERLGSDSGLDLFWCGVVALRWPAHPACVVLHTQSVIHTNTHTIHRFDRSEREHYMLGKDDPRSLNLFHYLMEHHDAELRAALRRTPDEARFAGGAAGVKFTSKVLDEWHARGSRMNPNASVARGCWGV